MSKEKQIDLKGMRAYEELSDIPLPIEQEKMMDIICDAWEECQQSDCRVCAERPHRNMRIMACTALKYTRLLREAGYRKMPDNIGEFSDGYHTFNELYHHRAVLFSVICNMFPNKAWKSKLHDTGDMFDGMFIVGIETEQGQATYHYDIEPYWDMFKVKELEKAPKWDGHTPSDAIRRIGNISAKGYRKQSENTVELPCKVGDTVYCIWQYGDFAQEDIPFIQETRVISFVIDEGVPKIIPANYGEMTDSWHRLLEIAFTKEEAEEALAKMKGGE